MTWLRALAAAVLSVLMPGSGHLLIRDWLRAVVVAGVFLSAVVFFFPAEQAATADSMTETVEVVTEETDTMSQFVLSSIALFAAIDSAFRALGVPSGGPNADGGPTCPQCGKELDEDLEFCHWCTARLEPEASDEEPIRS